MTVADPVLRSLFEEEAAEELGAIEALLPRAAEPEVARELYRLAHTIKGSAAVVGLGEVNRIAATLETLFGAVRDGERDPSPPSRTRSAPRPGSSAGSSPACSAASTSPPSPRTSSARSARSAIPPAGAEPGDAPAAAAPAGDELLRAIAAAQLATLRLTALQAGVEPASVPEHAALDAKDAGRGAVRLAGVA